MTFKAHIHWWTRYQRFQWWTESKRNFKQQKCLIWFTEHTFLSFEFGPCFIDYGCHPLSETWNLIFIDFHRKTLHQHQLQTIMYDSMVEFSSTRLLVYRLSFFLFSPELKRKIMISLSFISLNIIWFMYFVFSIYCFAILQSINIRTDGSFENSSSQILLVYGKGVNVNE